jgi:hypothetical protein
MSQFCHAQNVHVLVNIWDGTEWGKVESLYNANKLPALKSVGELHHLTSNEDCFDGNCMKTVTTPQHATMFTGCLADVTNIFKLDDMNLIPDGITVQELIKLNYPDVEVAQISGKRRNFGHGTFGNIMDDVDVYVQSKEIDELTFEAMVERLTKIWSKKSYFIVLHSRNPDEMGHQHLVNSAEYKGSIITNDRILKRIIDYMKYYKGNAKTIIYVLSDHGFGCPTTGNHTCSPNTFIASTNPALTHDLYMNEVADYFLSHFGLNSVCD